MSNVVAFESKLYPVGSMAFHRRHGLVEVFARDGLMCGVVYERHQENSLAGEPEDVLFHETIELREIWVPAKDLLPSDLKTVRRQIAKKSLIFDGIQS